MAERAAVVIVGGGIVGASVAYHLAELGRRDIIVVDQGPLPANVGSTSHAPGGVVAMSHDRLLARMSFYSTDLYRRLPRADAFRNTYNPVGSIEVARTAERMKDLVREHGSALAFGATTELLDPQQIVEKVPYLAEAAIAGGLWIPDSALVAGSNIVASLLAESGARCLPGSEVTAIEGDPVRSVSLANGDSIEAECVVIATNIWQPPHRGLPLPLLAFEHQYIETEELLDEFDPDKSDDEAVYPTVRDMDAALYFRHHWNRIGVGSYHHAPRPVAPGDVGSTADRPFTPDDLGGAWEAAIEMIPALGRSVEFSRSINGMFAFTVDGMPIIGESGTAGLWMAVGAWITHAGGVGKSLAELIVGGESEWDLRQASIDRFHEFATEPKYVSTVTRKNYREVYDLKHPLDPPSEPRDVRSSCFADRLERFDPHNSPFGGIELADWYGVNVALDRKFGSRVPSRSDWAKRNWSPIAWFEHLACRESGGVFDLTGLSIIEVKGPHAKDLVDHLCASDLDIAPGKVVYTLWLTPSGGIKRDLIVARLDEGRFWMFVGEGTRPQDVAWVRRHGSSRPGVTISDVSDDYAALGVWGPRAHAALSRIGDGWPSDFEGRWLETAAGGAWVMGVSYVGEPGYEIHMPAERAMEWFDLVWEAATAEQLVLAGSRAMNSLRMEKGYVLWGADVHTEYRPRQAGLAWTVSGSGDFIGAESFRSASTSDSAKRLRTLVVDSPNLMGYEPVMLDGSAVGYITSAALCPTVGRSVGMAYLPASLSGEGTPLGVLIEGEAHSARIAAQPLV